MFMYSKWMALPLTTRQALARKLGIAKTSPTHVQDNRIVSDGYNIGDIERAMAKVTDWDAMVAEAEGRELTANFTKGEQFTPTQPPMENVVTETNPEEKRFCNFCDSKGVRHKKTCTRPQ